jgi:drug/metabolite transporter (DMT)-like permease
VRSGKTSANRYLNLMFVLLPVVFWGVSFISTKVVLQEIPPVSIAFFRQLIALLPLFLWGVATRASFRIALKDLLLLMGSSFFGIVLYFVFENNGLRYTTASSASMIVAAVPVFTLLVELLFFNLKTNLKVIACIIASILGVYLVISVNGKLDFSSAAFKGNMLVMGAMASWVIYTVMSRKLANRYSSFLITLYQTILSSVLFLPFLLPEFGNWKPVSATTLLNLAYLGVFCSAVSYFMFLYAIKKLGPTVSSAFLNLIPVISVLAGYLILDEKLLPIQYGGMLVIMASLFILNKNKGKITG